MPADNLTVMPSSTLSQPSETTKRPNRFILFGQSWLNLQTYIIACQALPINQGDFVTKYGTFSDQSLVTGAFSAMQKIRNLSSTFGDPQILKNRIATDPNYLLGTTAPSEIYSHIVWLAIQIQNAASTFKFTFANIQEVIGPAAGTPAQRAANLKEILVGQGGLVSTADDMKVKTAALISKLATFDGNVTDANKEMVLYTGQSSKILTAANRLVKDYQDKIDNELKPASEKAWASWRDFTIAAVTTSIGLFAIGAVMFALAPVTFGATGIAGMGLMAGGVIAAGVLGNAAAQQRKLYNDLLNQIDQAEAEKKQKVALVNDLTGLNGQISLVGQGLGDFRDNLSVIQGVWVDIGGKLAYIANNYTVEQMSNYGWLNQTLKIMDAQNKWGEISTTTQEFTQNSLVNYQSGSFGTRIPEPAAA